MAAGNLFDQFDAPASGGEQANVFDQFDGKGSGAAPAPGAGNWLTKSASTGSTGPTTAIGKALPSWMTMPLTADEGVLPAAKDIALSGADYLALNQLKHIAPSLGDSIAQAHQNLGYADPVVGAASYLMPGIGPAKYLKAGTEALGMSGLGVGFGGKVAEGALAGGISGFDPNDPISSTLEGAGGGAVLGGAAHGIGKVANVAANSAANSGVGQAILRATGASMGDTAAGASAATGATSDAGYTALRGVQAQPAHVDNAFDQVMSGLSPSQKTGMSPGLKGAIQNIRDEINDQGVQGNLIDGDTINSWKRQINDAATNKIDGGIAAQLTNPLGHTQPGTLTGVLGAAGGAQLDQTATAAAQRDIMANKLQEWTTNLNENGISPGDEPLRQQQYYAQGSPEYNALGNIYKAGAQHTGGLSYLAGRAGGELAEAAGAAAGLGGIPTMLLGLGGHVLKYPIQGVQNVYKRANLANTLRQAYPALTGQSVGYNVPGVGNAIKALALSQGSSYGY